MEIIVKLQVSAAVILVAVSLACLLLRRAAFWTLFGLSLGVKGILLGALALVELLPEGNGRALVLLSLVGLGFLIIGGAVSFAVMIRAQNFSGTLDWEKEARMKH